MVSISTQEKHKPASKYCTAWVSTARGGKVQESYVRLNTVYSPELLEPFCARKVWEAAGIKSICINLKVSFVMAYNN